jgi:hypothetical protein
VREISGAELSRRLPCLKVGSRIDSQKNAVLASSSGPDSKKINLREIRHGTLLKRHFQAIRSGLLVHFTRANRIESHVDAKTHLPINPHFYSIRSTIEFIRSIARKVRSHRK